MDRAFIEKNQIVERYLAGKLPFKGAQDFERFCRENPETLDEIGFADAINKGMRLLEASARTGVHRVERPVWWRRPELAYGLLAALLVAVTIAWLQFDRKRELEAEVAELQERLETGPLRPPAGTRALRVVPDRSPSKRIHLTLARQERPELLELRVDLAFARLNTFRVTVDKGDQARVGTIFYVLRDSNGQLRVSLNTSSLHRGDYRIRIEGVTRRGQLVPTAWLNVRVVG